MQGEKNEFLSIFKGFSVFKKDQTLQHQNNQRITKITR